MTDTRGQLKTLLDDMQSELQTLGPVSYTHLTLPTIYSV